MSEEIVPNAALVEQLHQTRQEAAYYKQLARECGERRLQEAEELSRIIIQLRQTEKELAHARDELEQRVQERTAELQQTNTRLEILCAAMNEISAHLDITTLLQVILERAIALVGATCGYIVLYETENQPFRVATSINRQHSSPQQCCLVEEMTVQAMTQMGQPRLSYDGAGWQPCLGANELWPALPLILVPLLTGDNLIGMLSIYDHCPERRFNPAEEQLLSLFAHQAAIAMQNAHLFARVHHLATIDPLTGLYNRRRFFELAAPAVTYARDTCAPLSIMMLDIDHFKRVNDTYGHLAGDEVLRHVATVCKANLREADISARYGGEELIILLQQTDPITAQQIAERIRTTIAQTSVGLHEEAIAVTVSLGIATWNGTNELNLEGLINQADQALYQAKASGRNRVCW